MARPEIDWDDTDGFTAGAVGPQGRRVFFLQARRGGQVVSLKIEKQQVSGLADFLDGLMEDLPPVDKQALEVIDADTALPQIEKDKKKAVLEDLLVKEEQNLEMLEETTFRTCCRY